jgi:serine/threonine protein phosphatase 1
MNRRIAIGDIHGCYNTLKALLELKIKITRDDDIYFLGDLIDRGPESRKVIEYLIHLKQHDYNLYSVRGNHEDMFLKTLGDKSFMRIWFANGAEETLRSFNIPESKTGDFESLRLIPENCTNFIESLPYYYDLGDYLIVHAGFNFKSDNIFTDLNSMLWIRYMEYNADKASDKTIIHGHTPVPFIRMKSNISGKENKILNIDTGCVYNDLPGYGILSGLNLDTRGLFYQENIDSGY